MIVVSKIMKEYSNFLGEKSFYCNVEGCSMKFTNENHLTVHKKRHDMVLNLGLGQKGTSFTDQTPTPTQFIRNCEEVGLFQDLQNVNPFEETFKKAFEAVKSGQLSLEKSFQSTTPDDTLHTPNVFPHITDVPNINQSNISDKCENIPSCENDLTKQDVNKIGKNPPSDIIITQDVTQSSLIQVKKKSAMSLSNADDFGNALSNENKVILNVPEGHLVQLLTPPEDSQSSCNMVVIKNTDSDLFSPLPLTVKEKLKKSLSDKKTGKCSQYKVPILKCPVKRTSFSLNNKFSKFSKNAMKLISKMENSGRNELNERGSGRPKKINKVQTKESRSEFLARSRAASFRCREKKKMYLLYLEKVNNELTTANQNLLLINSLLCQEISKLHRELIKHKNCNAADKNTEAALTTAANLIRKKIVSEKEKLPEVQLQHQTNTKNAETAGPKVELFPFAGESNTALPEHQLDSNLFSFDVAEVILSEEPEENEIPLNEESKPPDIIVRFNSVGNDFPTLLPTDSHLDLFIEKAGDKVKQIYGEHSYYLKKYSMEIDKQFMNYKPFGETTTPPYSSEECKKLNAFDIQVKENDAFRDLTCLNSKVLIGPRTPPPLILLKPFKKRSLQNKRNEKT